MTLGICAGLIAPYYNAALALIVIVLFIKLFSIKKPKAYLLPWKYIFAAFVIFVIETIMTILYGLELITFPHVIFPFFELVIICLFIYALLLEKQHIK